MSDKQYGGYSVKELRDFITHSEASGAGFDAFTVSAGTSAEVIRDLLDAVERGRSDPIGMPPTLMRASDRDNQRERMKVPRVTGGHVTPLQVPRASSNGCNETAASAILNDNERYAIRRLACGDNAMFAEARAAFERTSPVHGPDACVELQFVNQMLSRTPDLLLRSQYRQVLLKQSKTR